MKELKKETEKDLKKDLKEVWERYYPIIIAEIFIAVVILINPDLCISDDINTILSAAISFASIIICFLGALVALIFSAENKIMNAVNESEYYSSRMKNFFLRPVQSGFIWVFLSIIFLFRETFYSLCTVNKIDSYCIMLVAKIIWLYLFIYFLLSAYRVISIILKISFIGRNGNKSSDENNMDGLPTDEEYEKIKNEKSI